MYPPDNVDHRILIPVGRLERVRQLVTEGNTYASIAMQLGISRASVAGMVHRYIKKKTEIVKRVVVEKQKKRRVLNYGVLPKKINAEPYKTKEPPFIGKPIKFPERQPNECPWIVGEVKNLKCCGADNRGDTYCPRHMDMAFQKARS